MDSGKQKDTFIARMANKVEIIHERELLPILFEFGIVQILYSISCIYLFGIFKGIIVGFAGYYTFYFIMKYFGYEMIGGCDSLSATEIHPHLHRNCTAYLKLGKIKTEDLRDKYFFNKGVLKFKRLRSIWIKRLGFWFFKEIDAELARNQVKRIDAEIHSQKDINEYLAKLTTKDFDKSKPLWEIHVIEDYDENTSLIFCSFHHILSDGMGIMSLMTFMNDSHNPDNIIQFREIPFFYYYILPVIYTPFGLLRYIYDGIMTKGDPNMHPFTLKNGKQSMKKEYFETKAYDLSDIKKCYNSFDKMKLNDFMFAIISASLSKHISELGIPEDKQTHFSLSIPINMKPQPKSIDDVQFDNSCSLCLANIPLSTNLEFTMKKNRETFDHGFSLTALRFGVWVVTFMGILPEIFSRLTIRDNSKRLNLIISNTPGPQNPIYFCDQMVYDMCGVGPNVGCSGLTLLISSYVGKVKLQMLTDSNLNMNPKKLLKNLEDLLDESIQKYAQHS